MEWQCIIPLAVFLGFVILFLIKPKSIVVEEGSNIITMKRNGKLSQTLGPGRRWLFFGEKSYATVPTRELVYESSLEKIYTKSLFPVTVGMIMHYQIVDPLKMARELPEWSEKQKTAGEEVAREEHLPRSEYTRWFRWQRAIEREAVEALFIVARQKGPTEVAKDPETCEKEIRYALLGKMHEYGVRIKEIRLKHVEVEKASIEYEWGKAMAQTEVELESIKAEGERAERVKDTRAEWGVLIETVEKLLEVLKKAGYDDDQAIQYVNSLLRHWALEKSGGGQVYVGIDTGVPFVRMRNG